MSSVVASSSGKTIIYYIYEVISGKLNILLNFIYGMQRCHSAIGSKEGIFISRRNVPPTLLWAIRVGANFIQILKFLI